MLEVSKLKIQLFYIPLKQRMQNKMAILRTSIEVLSYIP